MACSPFSTSSSIFPLTLCLLIFFTNSIWACQRKTISPDNGNEETESKESRERETQQHFHITDYVKTFENGCECGRPRDKLGRISGGVDAGKVPWQAALVYRNTRIPFCGGTLINNLYILTAAHCILNLSSLTMSRVMNPKASTHEFLIDNDFQVLLNAYKLTPLSQGTMAQLYKKSSQNSWTLDPSDQERDFEEGTIRLDIRNKIFHSEFIYEFARNGFDYDIALLELSKPVDLAHQNSPVPACLPQKNDESVTLKDEEGREDLTRDYQDEILTTVGWGRTVFDDPDSGSPVLQKLQVPAYSIKTCSRISGLPVSKRFICAGYKTKRLDIGKTDSGGPLLVEKSGRTVVVGLVSWGSGEKDGKVASAFSKVSEFLPWIFEQISVHEKSSQAARWCLEQTVENSTASEFVPEDINKDNETTKQLPLQVNGSFFSTSSSSLPLNLDLNAPSHSHVENEE